MTHKYTAATKKAKGWAFDGEDTYYAIHSTVKPLPAGAYTIRITMAGPMFSTKKLVTDELIPIPDTPVEEIVKSMDKFWQREEVYKLHKIVYKRGILLHGPPGSGKTATMILLVQKLVADGGLAIIAHDPDSIGAGLQQIRKVEPNRRIMVVIEDIDEIIENYGEGYLLSLLDGEDQVGNVVILATTNYLHKLPNRIVNRPSRFDEIRMIGMPSIKARRDFLTRLTRDLPEETLDKWAKETEGFGVAHIKELAVATQCLDVPYESVLARLNQMIASASAEAGEE